MSINPFDPKAHIVGPVLVKRASPHQEAEAQFIFFSFLNSTLLNVDAAPLRLFSFSLHAPINGVSSVLFLGGIFECVNGAMVRIQHPHLSKKRKESKKVNNKKDPKEQQ